MSIQPANLTVFNNVRQIISGIGASKQLANCCTKLNIHDRVLLVTDGGLASLGLHNPLLEQLSQNGIEAVVYCGVTADPDETIVNEAVKVALDAKATGVIGFGGGSSLDVAKMVALLGHQTTQDQLPDCYGVDQVIGTRLPLIQIPTTAGTGSEVTPIAIITTGATTKNACVSSVLMADTVLLDASFTAALPNHIAAATGIDAMVHALEAYTSVLKKNAISDGLAKQALQLLNANILPATRATLSLPAREKMLIGAMLAGQAFANAPVGAVHALAYPLGGHFHIPHGNSNALVLVEVMKFNLPAATREYAELALLLLPNLDNFSPAQQAQALIQHFADLLQKLNLTKTLNDYGITAQDIPRLADSAMQQTRLLQNNPRKLCLADAVQIYGALIQ